MTERVTSHEVTSHDLQQCVQVIFIIPINTLTCRLQRLLVTEAAGNRKWKHPLGFGGLWRVGKRKYN